MSQNNQTQQILEEAFNEVEKRFPTNSIDLIMTDILLQVNSENGQFTIFDDDDEEIYSAIVEEWIGAEEPFDEISNTIKQYISSNKETLENLSLLKPYSFVLVDDEKETISELYLVDDQLITIESASLMENLDADLDAFFEKLMKED